MYGGHSERRVLIRGPHIVAFHRDGGVLGRPFQGGNPGPDAQGVEVDHLQWRRDWRGRIQVRDLGTDLGTHVNGVRLGLDWHTVVRGSLVQLGRSAPWVMTDGRREIVAGDDDLVILSFFPGEKTTLVASVNGAPVYRLTGKRAQLLQLLSEYDQDHLGGWLSYRSVARRVLGTDDPCRVGALVNETRMRLAGVGLPHLVGQLDGLGLLRFDAPENVAVASAGFALAAVA